MVKFFIGLDLGQASDYTAMSILELLAVDGQRVYHVVRLERIRGEPYPDICEKITTIMKSPTLAGKTSLVVDKTGVGAPVVDLLRKSGLKLAAVSIHAGDNVTHEGDNWRTPKRDLVGALQVLLQSGRLKVAKGLKLGTVLQSEMLNFRIKIDPLTAHDSYSAWRDNDHDDLILATALAAWFAEVASPKPQHPFGVLPRPDYKITPAWKTGTYNSGCEWKIEH